jgi:hypothetical protein
MGAEMHRERGKMRWLILRGLLEVLRALLFIVAYIAPLVLFIWWLVVTIIHVVNGSVSLLDAVPAFLGPLVLYFALGGAVLLVLWVLSEVLGRLLPPAYHPRIGEVNLFGVPPPSEQAHADQGFPAAPVQCLDPECQALLDMRAGMQLLLDPATGKQVYPSASYGGCIRLSGSIAGLLLWIAAGAFIQVGNASQLPVAKIIADLCLIAGVVAFSAGLVISERKHKAAIARAARAVSCQCPRCGKWWTFRFDALPQAIS